MRKIVLLVALGCALTACSPDDPDPAAPSPSVTVTPSANPSTDPLYLEAVDVYKKFHKELSQAEMSGFQPSSLSPMIDPYVTGTMKEAFETAYQADRKSGLILTGTAPASLTFAPNPGTSRAKSVVSIRVCRDASNLQITDKDSKEKMGSGMLTYQEVFFQQQEGKMRGFAIDTKDIRECPIS